MNIREKQEQWEEEYLSPYATLSSMTKGRDIEEEECDIRCAYQRDRDRIIHSKSFRRLKDKTQVFLLPEGDHYRTRLTHTLEVSQIARTIAKALRLNEDLTEAIALGHDLGHTPFGHTGEHVLDMICEGGFKHNEQSLRIVEKIEKGGRGLNLTAEVRDGILNHKTSTMPFTLEGKIVRFSDKIAYLNHDIDDSVRAGILSEEDIPARYTDVLGESYNQRVNTIIHDIIISSEDINDIKMSEEVSQAMTLLRQFMFERVYMSGKAREQEDMAERLLESLFKYYLKNTDRLPDEYRAMIEAGERRQQIVCDYIAGMSDTYAINRFEEIFIPSKWQ